MCYSESGPSKTLSNSEGAPQTGNLNLGDIYVNTCVTELIVFLSFRLAPLDIEQFIGRRVFGMGPFLVVEAAPVSHS